jgi:hypothetical protein
MVEAGHVECLDYGFGFFIDAVNEHEKIKLEQLASTAFAARAAQAEEKDWIKFLRSCGVKVRAQSVPRAPLPRPPRRKR